MSAGNIKVIPPLVEKGIKQAFQVQLSCTSAVKAFSMDKAVLSKYSLDCISSISLKSSTLIGLLSLGFSTPTYCGLFEKMLGEKIEAITPDNSDAAGEVLNIIYGVSRKEINEAGFDFEPAIPTTVIGKSLEISKANMAGQSLFFECTSDVGDFMMMLTLRSIVQQAQPAA